MKGKYGARGKKLIDQKGLVDWLKKMIFGMLVMGRQAGPLIELKLAADQHVS